jgi:hypothetical protein
VAKENEVGDHVSMSTESQDLICAMNKGRLKKDHTIIKAMTITQGLQVSYM